MTFSPPPRLSSSTVFLFLSISLVTLCLLIVRAIQSFSLCFPSYLSCSLQPVSSPFVLSDAEDDQGKIKILHNKTAALKPFVELSINRQMFSENRFKHFSPQVKQGRCCQVFSEKFPTTLTLELQ